MTERELFLFILSNLPLLKADAVVVFCGEDGIERTKVGVTAIAQGGADTLVLTGYEECGEGARTCFAEAIGLGVAPSRILMDERATNTAQQARYTAELARVNGWRRVLLACSPYHMPRAFLTLLRALDREEASEDVQVLPIAADHLPWFGEPRRDDLLAVEMQKIYEHVDDVCTFSEGLAYLEHWEGK